MHSNLWKQASLAAAAGAVASVARAADAAAVDELIAKIKSQDEKVRTRAWLGAGQVGAAAVKPLAETMTDANREVALAAKRALAQIVHDAGRPGANQQEKAVMAELPLLLGDERPAAVRREVLWLISEIGGDESVDAVAALLTNTELREDARCVLQRIPGDKSLAALRAGLKSLPADFRPAVAESLRARGVPVSGYPDQKLVPTKPTGVKPVGR
jgi:HEAT repeat protein